MTQNHQSPPFKNTANNYYGIEDFVQLGEMGIKNSTSPIKSPIMKNNFMSGTEVKIGNENDERLYKQIEELKSNNSKLLEKNEELKELIKKTPVNARDIDFAVLEHKINMLEKERKLDAYNTTRNFQRMLQTDGAVEEKSEGAWKREKTKLVQIIKKKNREIAKFRQELDQLMLTLSELRKRG